MLVFRGSGDSPKKCVCQAQARVWKWRQNFTFKINIPTVYEPASTNKVFIFKLIVEESFKDHFELIGSKFLPLAPIKSVAQDTRSIGI